MKTPTVSCSIVVESPEIPDSYLLVMEGAKRYEGLMGLPGGGLEPREGLIDAGVRETEEETGLAVRPDRLVGVYQDRRTPSGRNLSRFVLGATVTGGEIQTSPRHPEVGYFTYNAIKKLAKEGRLREGALRAIKDHRGGNSVPLDVIKVLPEKQPKGKKKK